MGTTQTDQILNLIRAAGPEGAPNYKLSDIALQYNFHIHMLRKKGFNIKKRRAPALHDGKQSQTFYYYLAGSSEVRTEPVKVDDVETVPEGKPIGRLLFKGRNISSEGYQRGQIYELTVGPLSVGHPVQILSPFKRSYPDMGHFNKEWGMVA